LLLRLSYFFVCATLFLGPGIRGPRLLWGGLPPKKNGRHPRRVQGAPFRGGTLEHAEGPAVQCAQASPFGDGARPYAKRGEAQEALANAKFPRFCRLQYWRFWGGSWNISPAERGRRPPGLCQPQTAKWRHLKRRLKPLRGRPCHSVPRVPRCPLRGAGSPPLCGGPPAPKGLERIPLGTPRGGGGRCKGAPCAFPRKAGECEMSPRNVSPGAPFGGAAPFGN